MKKLISLIFMVIFMLSCPIWFAPLVAIDVLSQYWELITVVCDNPKNAFNNFHKKLWKPKEQA